MHCRGANGTVIRGGGGVVMGLAYRHTHCRHAHHVRQNCDAADFNSRHGWRIMLARRFYLYCPGMYVAGRWRHNRW